MKLALGTAQFGMQYGVANSIGQPSEVEVKEILQIASSHGINTLDTAIAYGDCEERLGRIGVPNWQIISKLPAFASDTSNIYEEVRSVIQGSLQRLGVDQIYGLLLHRPEQLLEKNGEDLYRALEQVKKDGLVHKIGISIYDPASLEIILPSFNFDLAQIPFSPFDQRVIFSGWASRLKSLGIELHVRSIFLQGLLLMENGKRPNQFDRWSPLWRRWHEWLQDMNITALQACLGFVASFPQIDRILVGVENTNQLLEIIEGVQRPALAIPDEFYSTDLDLINPANWSSLNSVK
ncbi:aldo/keto reductase [Polynucleobacter bastaniensis]|uniref:aldo/keto reductase n=1 Tax=Polynucleobacter bastaniensis TaxID=2081039 RepID=UPI0034E210F6|nr:aldo/keto reductase [Polynucleobacter bastaniensis]